MSALIWYERVVNQRPAVLSLGAPRIGTIHCKLVEGVACCDRAVTSCVARSSVIPGRQASTPALAVFTLTNPTQYVPVPIVR